MASSDWVAAEPVHVSASNTALATGNQREAFIALDPTDTDRLFYFAMTEPFSNGLFAAHSTDGGASWAPTTIAVGPGGDIPAGRVDPWAVFSDAGRLFISYDADPLVDESATFGIPAGFGPVVVAQSNDGGASFQFLEALEPMSFGDRASMATGSGASVAAEFLWIVFADLSGLPFVVKVRGAALDSAGDPVLDSCGVGTGYFC